MIIWTQQVSNLIGEILDKKCIYVWIISPYTETASNTICHYGCARKYYAPLQGSTFIRPTTHRIEN